MSSDPSPQPLRAVTRAIDPAAVPDMLAAASASDPTVWTRRGDMMVGVGDVARFDAPGDTRAVAAWWRGLAQVAVVDDAVAAPGTGLVAFGALPFDPQAPAGGSIHVPALVIARRGETAWLTRIAPLDEASAEPAAPAPTPFGPHWSATLGPGRLSPAAYQDAVRAGLAAIADGDVDKVVLARDLVGTVPPGSDLRRLVRALAGSYPDTWTFAVDGLIGASPETLVTVAGGTVTARVLAGTTARGADAPTDAAAAAALAASTKDLDEHEYAVQSVLGALRPLTSSLTAAEQPFTLKLPNVWHLATDVEGRLSAAASALDLLAVLHPTAAVAGTPTASALHVIRRVEPFDRGRYAGPVGWIDANGDGEWAIALRCAQFDVHTAADAPIPLVAHAGAGIVADSDPESELLETRVKFRPIVDALA